MSLAVGVDVAKEVHWAEIKVAGTGKVLASHAVGNTPEAIAALIGEIREAEAGHGAAVVGIDLGGIAGLLEAMLLEAGLALVHVPGLAVNWARRGTAGGERMPPTRRRCAGSWYRPGSRPRQTARPSPKCSSPSATRPPTAN
jgi:hypothetical protein